MRRVVGAVLLLLVTTLAGCADGPQETGGVDGSDRRDGVGNEAASVPVPTWSVGDHWTYKGSFGSTFALVVSEDSGSEYILDTDHEDLAFYHALFDPISYLGPMSKTTLAGDEAGDRVVFFDFPLEHNKTWTTRLDGTSLDVTAHDQGDGRFHMMAHEGDVMRHQWVYDNNTRFLAWLSMGDENGTEQFRIDLEDSGTGWTGELVRVTPELVLDVQIEGPGQETDTLDLSGAGDADLYAGIFTTCTQGQIAVAAGPIENIQGIQGSDDGYTDISMCPWEQSYFGVIGWEPDQGTWGYSVAHASPDAITHMTLWLRHFERIAL